MKRPDRLPDLVVRGDLSATAWFAVVDEHAEQWVDHRLLPTLAQRLTLHYPEVAILLASTIGVLFVAAVGVGVTLL